MMGSSESGHWCRNIEETRQYEQGSCDMQGRGALRQILLIQDGHNRDVYMPPGSAQRRLSGGFLVLHADLLV